MNNNLLISYDLHEPGKNYEKVITAIKALSSQWAKVHYLYWYVTANLTAEEAGRRVWQAMDSNDSLFVVDATNNDAAWYNLAPKVSEYMKQNWAQRRAA